ncbi:hypothetical protein KY366_04870 [Candidatus Woesearchaeota archaeon]|nr:hypothetical protein [Candidatus Woesearchaeota archaeon]
MFDFVWKVKKSFRRVRKDIGEFRENVNDWVIFLDGKDNQIEKKMDKIEARLERLEEAMFRVLNLKQ